MVGLKSDLRPLGTTIKIIKLIKLAQNAAYMN
jgi:hypothetical protein